MGPALKCHNLKITAIPEAMFAEAGDTSRKTNRGHLMALKSPGTDPPNFIALPIVGDRIPQQKRPLAWTTVTEFPAAIARRIRQPHLSELTRGSGA
jgi:hypothetical protein